MKENLLGPHKWALVVISGGAACALPFIHRDDPAGQSQIQSQSEPIYEPGGAGIAHTPAGGPSTLDRIVSTQPTQQLPEWANTDRSPFDDLVGITATPSPPKLPESPPPMQPLRPWIAGPGELSTPTSSERPWTSTTPVLPRDRQESVAKSIASPRGRSPADASPWVDQSQSWSSADAGKQPSSSALAQVSASEVWPDQKLSPEEVSKLTRAAPRELSSAVVAATALPHGHVPPFEPPQRRMIPSLTRNPSTRPDAAQLHFGQAPVFSNDPARAASNPIFPPTSQSGETTRPPLPALPESRKKHIIFQPSSRK